MDKIAIIILNYNTWEETLKEVKNIKNVFNGLKCELIVVDNCSSNDSYEKLKKSNNNRYTLLVSSDNGGYARGNNIGIRYATKKGYKYSLIINNDIVINDKSMVNKLISVFEKASDIAVVSPDIYSPDGYLYNRDAIRLNFLYFTIGALVYKKIGRSEKKANQGWMYVYRPQGCCMLVDNTKIEKVNYFDEHTFLYCEEIILAERLLQYKYKCACCVDTSVVHNHSYTTKSYLSKKKYVETNLMSFDYYLKQYRNYSILKRKICKIFMVIKIILTKQI